MTNTTPTPERDRGDELRERAGRVPTPKEAHEILCRFIDSHFRKDGKLHARFTIPADVNNDDDLLLGSFIDNYARLLAQLDEKEQQIIELTEAIHEMEAKL